MTTAHNDSHWYLLCYFLAHNMCMCHSLDVFMIRHSLLFSLQSCFNVWAHVTIVQLQLSAIYFQKSIDFLISCVCAFDRYAKWDIVFIRHMNAKIMNQITDLVVQCQETKLVFTLHNFYHQKNPINMINSVISSLVSTLA